MIQYYYVLALKARTDYMFCAGFFHTRKNLKNFSKEVIKSHLAVLIWCGKRDKHFSNHKGKEVRLMKPSDFQKTVQCRFESCLKKVVRSVVKDYYKELNRRKNKEISFSELPDVLVDKMAVWDDYETDYTIFSVLGTKYLLHEVTDAKGYIIHRDFDAVRILSGQLINKAH